MTLQYFDDEGARHELVGLFEKAEMDGPDPILHIRAKDDSLVKVPLKRIRHGRVVRPAR